MKDNQNLPNEKVTSNNKTGKPLPIAYRSRGSSRDNRDTSRHRSPIRISITDSKPYYRYNNFKPPSRLGSS